MVSNKYLCGKLKIVTTKGHSYNFAKLEVTITLRQNITTNLPMHTII
jgi:hypothetical protein